MHRKVCQIRYGIDFGQNVIVELNEFDRLVDEGYDDILIITPDKRYIASLDDFMDYGYIELAGDIEVRVLHRSFLGLA